MKTYNLGIIGLGYRTTAYYLKKLNSLYNNNFGGDSTCPYFLLNVNFDKINPFLPYQFDKYEPVLQTAITTLTKQANLDAILVPNITLHQSLNKLNGTISVIDPILLGLEELNIRKIKKVVIVGSTNTMKEPFFREQFATHGIELLSPSQYHITVLNQLRIKIYEEIETTEDLNIYKEIITQYTKNSTVIIACTELSIPVIPQKNIIDLANLQIENAIKNFKVI